jgi:long-chain acyl-CoA synthetase
LEYDDALVALLVPDEQAIRQRGALREAAMLREELEEISLGLAPYQRATSHRVTREPLPRTQLGKLKRHLLPDRYRDAAAGEAREKPAELSDEDRRLLSSDPAGAVWQWLEQRFPDRQLTLDTSPQLELQIDSLEWVSMTLELERRFKVSLDGDAVSRIMSLRDLLREIEAAEPAESKAAERDRVIEPPGFVLRLVGGLLFGLSRMLMRTLFRLRVAGGEQLASDQPLLITPNHASYLDPLAVAAALPWRRLRKTYWAGWVGKMYAGPLSRFVSRATRVFPVDPDKDLAAAIGMARSLLGQGYSLVWFPEGRRSPTGKLGQFLPGIGVLLEDTEGIVVPTAILGSFEAWPSRRRMPRLGPLRVCFGRPTPSSTLKAAGRGDDDAERIRSALQDEVERLIDGDVAQ